MALVERSACDWAAANTGARLAGVALGARAAVIADSAIGFRGIGALPGARVAGAYLMTLVERSADDWISPNAATVLTRIVLSTGVAVLADCPVGPVGRRASPGRWIARALSVALVCRRTRYRAAPHTCAGLARVCLCTCVGVIARRALGFRGIRTGPCCRVTRAGRMTLIERGAHNWIGSRASTVLANVRLGAAAAVIACRPVGLGWVRTRASGGIARASLMTLIERRARDWVCARAHTVQAGVGLGAAVSVIACRAVCSIRVRTLPSPWIARANVVALIKGGADHRISTSAYACLTRVGLSAAVGIVARRSVGLAWIGTRPRCRITATDSVTLIKSGADH
jgi:hypothetical protein